VDDARRLAIFAPEQLPPVLAFDHSLILSEYLKVRPHWLDKVKIESEI
jgi:8-oxo-dGTP diphosphatase